MASVSGTRIRNVVPLPRLAADLDRAAERRTRVITTSTPTPRPETPLTAARC